MKKILTTLLLFPLVLVAAARRGGSTGGGYAVYCEEPISRVVSVRLLDYYEADLLLPELKLDLGDGNSEVDLAQNVLARLRVLDAKRADAYSAKVRRFLMDTRFIQENVPDVNDYGFAPLGDGCVLKQVAVQNLVPIPEGKKYTINKPLWDRLSTVDKAGLILHELVYEEALSLGQKDSRNSRYFNALISSRQVSSLTGKQYAERLKAVGLPASAGGRPDMVLELPAGHIAAVVNQPFHFDLAEFVLSTNNHPLQFSKLGGAPWAVLSSKGQLTGTPSATDIGSNVLRVGVTDGTLQAEGQLTIEVDSSGRRWLPQATEGQAFRVDFLDIWPLAKGCSDKAVDFVRGKNWMNLSGTVLSGTPSAAEVGVYEADFDFEQTCYEEVTEFLPGGGQRVHQVPATRTTRVRFKGRVETANVANGTDVPVGDFDEVFFLQFGSSGCQATLVGPRAFITTASCVGNSKTTAFEFRGATYQAKLAKHPKHSSLQLDVALGIVDRPVNGALPLSVGGKVKVGDAVELLAFSDFSSGRGTRLQAHQHRITRAKADLWEHRHPSGLPSIIFGNSGAALLAGRRNVTLAGIVNSSSFGSIPQNVFSTRLDNLDVRQFLSDTAATEGISICGLSIQCEY